MEGKQDAFAYTCNLAREAHAQPKSRNKQYSIMRTLVIDDEQLVLEGLEAFLQASLPDISLDKTADLNTAIGLAASVKYQLVLLDWHLANGQGSRVDGRRVIHAIRANGQDVPILIVSGDGDAPWHDLVMEMNLSGMVHKSSPGQSLLDAIQVAMNGGVYLPRLPQSKRQSGVLLHPMAPGSGSSASIRQRFVDLTDRQCEVFEVMARGMSDKQIARELGISESTVKTHVRGILDAVGVRRRGEAIFLMSQQTHGKVA